MEKMRVISEPDRARRRVFEGDTIPYVSENGVGDGTYQCGACDTVLVKDSWAWTIQNIVFRCPGCSAYNMAASSSVLA